jgi:hypothetical protein
VLAAGLLQQSNASNASYLFQPDKLNQEYDLGDKTIQCGRRADAFKLWLAWKVSHPANLNPTLVQPDARTSVFCTATHFQKASQQPELHCKA